jgi:DNA-binding NtrC family response regulator
MPHARDEEDRTRTAAPALDAGEARVVVFWHDGHATAPLSSGARLTVGRGSDCDLSVRCTSVSRLHAVLHVGPPHFIEDCGSANGTRVRGERIAAGARVPLEAGAAVEIGSALMVLQEGASHAQADAARAAQDPMQRAVELARMAAASVITVLLLGETGVGKGHLAEIIHRASPRAARPFVPLNCAALPEQLLESELFGHEKGAFTGADAQRPGLLEAAEGGTVFLDEVGDLPLATQAKLLRALESRSVMRVGGRRPVPIDVRFVAATNRDLEALIAERLFRQDLYYRINGFALRVPPLRERCSEIPALAAAFASEAAAELGRAPAPFSTAALGALVAHGWPGNVRELRNVVERAVLLSGGAVIDVEHVVLGTTGSEASAAPSAPHRVAAPASGGDLRADLAEVERRRILDALGRAGGNQTRAAELLGISRRSLLRRLDEHVIERPRKPPRQGL